MAVAFKDDPFWDDYIRIMKDLRQEGLERDLRWLEDAENPAMNGRSGGAGANRPAGGNSNR